jgi:hypothetical protein
MTTTGPVVLQFGDGRTGGAERRPRRGSFRTRLIEPRLHRKRTALGERGYRAAGEGNGDGAEAERAARRLRGLRPTGNRQCLNLNLEANGASAQDSTEDENGENNPPIKGLHSPLSSIRFHFLASYGLAGGQPFPFVGFPALVTPQSCAPISN